MPAPFPLEFRQRAVQLAREGTIWRRPVVLAGRTCDVCSRFRHPARTLRVTHEVEEPAKQCEAIPAPQPKPGSVVRKSVRKRPRIVVDGADRVCNDMCNCLGVFLVVEEIGGDPRRPGNRHSLQDDPLARLHRPVMQPDVLAARLPPHRQDELLPVRGEVPETVERSRGPVGDDPLHRRSLPRRNVRGELQPRCPKVQVIRRRCPRKAVHALGHPVKDTRGGEALQGGS